MTRYQRAILGLSTLGLCAVLSSNVFAGPSFSPGGSYGEKIGQKALNGFSNIVTGPLEIPKNIVNTTNQSNVFYGFVGGLFKGIVNTGGRMCAGIADLITFPIPTQPIAEPIYIWNDFDIDTTYGEVFRLDSAAPAINPVNIEPVVEPIAEPAPSPMPPVYDSEPYLNNENTQKLDAIFQDRMMK